mgnify:CR=1 FL=1
MSEIKYHVDDWPEYHEQGANGRVTLAPISLPQKLSEPVPSYSKRPGDWVLKSPEQDNNAAIILGRDRNPFGPTRRNIHKGPGSNEHPGDDDTVPGAASGYSDYMRAGAIDLVVGRGAPYPLEKMSFSRGEQLPPLFKTQPVDELLGKALRSGVDDAPDGILKPPGYVMDAARIYISQKTLLYY